MTVLDVLSNTEIRLATEAPAITWEEDALAAAVDVETGAVVRHGLVFLLSQEVISTTCMLVALNCFLNGTTTEGVTECPSVSVIADALTV